jgi:general stress protein 26
MDVQSFSEIQADLEARVSRIVWCTVATVDTKGRPRVRILHPMWEGSTAWICTGRHSFKEKHLARNPFVSLSYWDPKHEQVYAECHVEWIDDVAEKQRIWELFKAAPSPYGYDPAMFWPGGPASDDFGVMKCTPWRIQLAGITPNGFENRVWRLERSAAGAGG